MAARAGSNPSRETPRAQPILLADCGPQAQTLKAFGVHTGPQGTHVFVLLP